MPLALFGFHQATAQLNLTCTCNSIWNKRKYSCRN